MIGVAFRILDAMLLQRSSAHLTSWYCRSYNCETGSFNSTHQLGLFHNNFCSCQNSHSGIGYCNDTLYQARSVLSIHFDWRRSIEMYNANTCVVLMCFVTLVLHVVQKDLNRTYNIWNPNQAIRNSLIRLHVLSRVFVSSF